MLAKRKCSGSERTADEFFPQLNLEDGDVYFTPDLLVVRGTNNMQRGAKTARNDDD